MEEVGWEMNGVLSVVVKFPCRYGTRKLPYLRFYNFSYISHLGFEGRWHALVLPLIWKEINDLKIWVVDSPFLNDVWIWVVAMAWCAHCSIFQLWQSFVHPITPSLQIAMVQVNFQNYQTNLKFCVYIASLH